MSASASAAPAYRKRKRAAAAKTVTLKNQIRSTERLLRKVLVELVSLLLGCLWSSLGFSSSGLWSGDTSLGTKQWLV